MARFVFAMNVSLDGYVDHDRFVPDPELFRHWVDETRIGSGSLYGRRLYEIMRYWEDEDPGWSDDERAFAEAWFALPKWVVSRSLTEVGPNATLVPDSSESALRELKDSLDGDIDVGGPELAGHLTALGLIDEYRLYLHPVVLGHGVPFFRDARPRLRLTASDRIGPEAIRLTYVPA